MALLPTELFARDLVLRIGRNRALRVIDSLSRRTDRRVRHCDMSGAAFLFTSASIRRSQWEVELFYQLKLGIMLTDTDNTPEAARARITQRRAQRVSIRNHI